jgi:outer membrane protein TolC
MKSTLPQRLLRFLFVGVLSLVVPVVANGQGSEQTVGSFRLDDAIHLALERNPEVAMVDLEAEALRYVAPQASTLPEPVFQVGIAASPVHTARGTQRSQWRLEQTIPFPGKRRLRAEAAQFRADAAGFASDALRHGIVLNVRLAYVRIFSLQQQLETLGEFREEVSRFEEAAAAEYEVGRGPQQALLRAQLERNALAKRELVIRTHWQEAVRSLARSINDPALIADTLQVERPVDLESIDLTGAYDRAVDLRPEFRAIESARESADRAVRLAQRDKYPDVTLQVTYTDIARDSPPVNPDGKDAVTIGAGIRLPIWRKGLDAKRQQREIERRRLDEHRRMLETDVSTRIRELKHRIGLEQKNLVLLSEGLIPQAEITRDATLAAYTTGRIGFLDLLEAERMLFELQLDEIVTLQRLHEAVATMHRTIGSPVDLKQP